MKPRTVKSIERGFTDAVEDNRDSDFAVIAARVAYARLIHAKALDVTPVQKDILSMALIGSGLHDVARDLLFP